MSELLAGAAAAVLVAIAELLRLELDHRRRARGARRTRHEDERTDVR